MDNQSKLSMALGVINLYAVHASITEEIEALEAEMREEQAWEDMQEYGGNRCPPRE